MKLLASGNFVLHFLRRASENNINALQPVFVNKQVRDLSMCFTLAQLHSLATPWIMSWKFAEHCTGTTDEAFRQKMSCPKSWRLKHHLDFITCRSFVVNQNYEREKTAITCCILRNARVWLRCCSDHFTTLWQTSPRSLILRGIYFMDGRSEGSSGLLGVEYRSWWPPVARSSNHYCCFEFQCRWPLLPRPGACFVPHCRILLVHHGKASFEWMIPYLHNHWD